jgi:hypothetical protein
VAQRKGANYIERMQKRSKECEDTKRAEPFFPDRSDLTYGPETIGQTLTHLIDVDRTVATREFALIKERLQRGVA